MREYKPGEIQRLKAKIASLEDLITKWQHANDPESKWMLYLLNEVLEMGYAKLKYLRRRGQPDEPNR